MGLEQKTTHIQEALDHLVAQFQGKPKLAAMISAYITQVQDLETVWFELLEERWLENAEGVQIDGFGQIVGEAREGRTDLAYKTAIRARMVLNRSQGTTEDIIELIRGIAGDVLVRVTDYYPAGFVAQVMTPIDPDYVDISKIGVFVRSGRPAGVDAIVIFGVEGSFRFDAGPGYDIGKWAGAII